MLSKYTYTSNLHTTLVRGLKKNKNKKQKQKLLILFFHQDVSGMAVEIKKDSPFIFFITAEISLNSFTRWTFTVRRWIREDASIGSSMWIGELKDGQRWSHFSDSKAVKKWVPSAGRDFYEGGLIDILHRSNPRKHIPTHKMVSCSWKLPNGIIALTVFLISSVKMNKKTFIWRTSTTFWAAATAQEYLQDVLIKHRD